MNKLMPIGLIAVLSGTATVALAQAPTTRPDPTQQTTPNASGQTTPRTDSQHQNAPADHAAAPTAASKEAMGRHAELQSMDTNSDGLISRPEYMAYYESEYGKMKKDSAGMISLKDHPGSATPIASAR